MDKGRRRKGKGLKREKSSTLSETEIVTDVFETAGMTKLPLSEVCQRIIGCVAGVDLDLESRWKYVSKELIEDNIELHEESSEFLPIKKEIRKYGELEVLVGLSKEIDEQHQFYFCLTDEVKEKVLGLIQQQQDEIDQKLRNAVNKSVGVWQSMGSEEEVDLLNRTRTRHLFEVEVESIDHIASGSIKFELRLPHMVRDGYIEILPQRTPYNLISRKRLDNWSQIAPSFVTQGTQANLDFAKNTWTQYEYNPKVTRLTADLSKHCDEFVGGTEPEVTDMMGTLSYMDLHYDDYIPLVKARKTLPIPAVFPVEFMTLHHIESCEGNLITSMSWHPTLTGILAVSYAPTTYNHISKQIPKKPLGSEQAMPTPVLIWSFSDYLKPKLYLKTTRYVNTVHFNPVNHNIVVAGCTNGQMIIWDITGRLEKIEAAEILTDKQQKNRFMLYSMIKWMRDTDDKAVVHPTALSSMEHRHKDEITYLKFFGSEQRMTVRGIMEEVEVETNQLLTSGYDGMICFWDITLKEQEPEDPKKARRKNVRLKQIPEALLANVSPYKQFHNVLQPFYKICWDNPATGTTLRISTMCAPRLELHHEPRPVDARTDDTVRIEIARTRETRKVKRAPTSLSLDKHYILGTVTGQLSDLTWDGYDFDTGKTVNVDRAITSDYGNIHDGPVVRVTENVMNRDLFLTVGGTIFAIWYRYYKHRPLIWKKAGNGWYTNGNWENYEPSACVLLRSDGECELWDFLFSTKQPLAEATVSGDAILRICSSESKIGVRNNCFTITDNAGALKVQLIPNVLCHPMPDLTYHLKLLLERMLGRKKTMDQRSSDLKTQMQLEPTVVEARRIEFADDAPEEFTRTGPVKMTAVERFNKRQEIFMYETMLQRKKLNVTELEKYRKPLQQIKDDQEMTKRNTAAILKTKDGVFVHAKDEVYNIHYDTDDRVFTVPVEESAFQYSDYLELEMEQLDKVQRRPYRRTFNWNQVIHNKWMKDKAIKKTEFHVRFVRHDTRKTMRTQIEDALQKTFSQFYQNEKSDVSLMGEG